MSQRTIIDCDICSREVLETSPLNMHLMMFATNAQSKTHIVHDDEAVLNLEEACVTCYREMLDIIIEAKTLMRNRKQGIPPNMKPATKKAAKRRKKPGRTRKI